MNYSESAIERIRVIEQENNVDLIDATSMFCEEYDIDYNEFVKLIDDHFKDQLKLVAIETRRVRRSIGIRLVPCQLPL